MRALNLQYSVPYEHVAELEAERVVGLEASCIWHCVQAHALGPCATPTSEK
jgi:hypothetical protein